MRAYEFRGRDANGKWHTGDLIQIEQQTYIRPHDVIERKIQVDPKSVGQYTGCFDTNYVPVYEGDIVRVTDQMIGVPSQFRNFEGVVRYANNSFTIEADGFIHYRWIDYIVQVLGAAYDKEHPIDGGKI